MDLKLINEKLNLKFKYSNVEFVIGFGIFGTKENYSKDDYVLTNLQNLYNSIEFKEFQNTKLGDRILSKTFSQKDSFCTITTYKNLDKEIKN